MEDETEGAGTGASDGQGRQVRQGRQGGPGRQSQSLTTLEAAALTIHNAEPMRQRMSFRLVLFLMLIALVTSAVLITGKLSVDSSKRAIEEMALLLREEYASRVQENLRSFLRPATSINRLNAEMIHTDAVDPSDLDEFSLHLWKQLEVVRSVNWVAFGRADGNYVAYLRMAGDSVEVDRLVDGALNSYAVGPQGEPRELIRSAAGYDPRERPW